MFGACSKEPTTDVAGAYARMGTAGHVLLDVRTRDEVRAQGIKGALNIPLDELEGAAGQLAKYEVIDVICRSGGRSAMATQMLHELGLKQARNVSGGMLAWTRADLPTI